MARRLSDFIVALTALSTVLAGVPGTATAPDIGTSCAVSAQPGTDADDAGKPRGEQDSEELEEEAEPEVELLAERAVVCSIRCDKFFLLHPADRADSLRLIWTTTLIRGPPASA